MRIFGRKKGRKLSSTKQKLVENFLPNISLHDEKNLNLYKKACELVFKKIAFYEKIGKIKDMLDGPVKQMGFKRLTWL